MEEYRKTGALLPAKRLYVRAKIENLQQKEGSLSYQSLPEYFEKAESHLKDELNFVENVVKQLPEYSRAVDGIAIRAALHQEQARF